MYFSKQNQLIVSKSEPALFFLYMYWNIHYCIWKLAKWFVDVVHVVFCCLISRDEEEGALRLSDADENLILAWKTGTLHQNVLLLLHKDHSFAVYINKNMHDCFNNHYTYTMCCILV